MKHNTQNQLQNFHFQRWIAFAGVLLFLIKLLAWHLTHSDAVFSDALESIVNIVAAFMGLYSLYLAAKPKDEDHPYGHGKVEFVTSGIEGALIIIAGVIIILQAIHSLIQGSPLKELDWGIYLVGFTALLNYLMGYLSIRKGKKQNSLVLQSSGKHLQSDTLTTLGVVLSLVLVSITGLRWIDSVVAIAFGAYIMVVGYRIIRTALGGIMDEADLRMIENLATHLEKNRTKEWVDLHNVKIQQHGSTLHLDAHLTLPYYYSLRMAHDKMEEMIETIVTNTERTIEFNFHMDDCKSFSCKICQMDDCPVREFKFERRVPWTKQTITGPDKHDVNS